MCFTTRLIFWRVLFSLSFFIISSLTSSNGLILSGVISSSLMIWNPKDVFIGSLVSFGLSFFNAFSNSVTIIPSGNSPRLPPFFPETVSSEYFFANPLKLAPFRIFFKTPSASFFASSSAFFVDSSELSSFASGRNRMWAALYIFRTLKSAILVL